jgi:hypothetical protein
MCSGLEHRLDDPGAVDLLLRSQPDMRPWLLRALTGRRPAPPAGELKGPGARLTARELMAPSLVAVRPEDSLAHYAEPPTRPDVVRLAVAVAVGVALLHLLRSARTWIAA